MKRVRLRTTLGGSAVLLLVLSSGGPAMPQENPWARPTLNFMGVPGLLDIPTAHATPDADLNLTLAVFEKTVRGTLHFQITPRLSGVFRYVQLRDFSNQDPYYDRSFDLRYLLTEEGRYSPAVSVGLQDFGGTGIYSGEYIVATKTVGRVRATGGIGWGRFGSYNGFDNPLGVLADSFKTRPEGDAGINQTGRVDTNQWFRGDAALFGGLQYAASDQLLFSAEYSSDAYDDETNRMGFERKSPFSFGTTYHFKNGFDLSGAYLYGSTLGVSLNYTFNPKTPNAYPGGIDRAPQSVLVRAPGSAQDLGWTTQLPQVEPTLAAQLDSVLSTDDMRLERFSIEARRAQVAIRIGRQPAGPQAIGRTARLLTRILPASVEQFEITLVSPNGLPVTTVDIGRSDLEDLEYAPDGAWQSFARARIKDARVTGADLVSGAFPKFDWGLGPYLRAAYFDPANPVRLSFGMQLEGRFEPTPGFVLQGELRKRISGNIRGLPPSNSILPRVRSDNNLYAEAGDGLLLNRLTATRYFRPRKDLFARVSAGYFEQMFAGVSGELLWQPIDSRLGLGVELNHVWQRNFDQGFGLGDYNVTTGHVSAYYKTDPGFLYQVDAGRYLAGDWGTTLGVDREFGNGIRIGAFATFTDVSFDDFGEGSFDKGIRVHIPLAALTGARTQGSISRTIRPVQRDGGARVEMNMRLYEQVRDYRQPELQEQWGRFWR